MARFLCLLLLVVALSATFNVLVDGVQSLSMGHSITTHARIDNATGN
jgi:hypothetical protein